MNLVMLESILIKYIYAEAGGNCLWVYVQGPMEVMPF